MSLVLLKVIYYCSLLCYDSSCSLDPKANTRVGCSFKRNLFYTTGENSRMNDKLQLMWKKLQWRHRVTAQSGRGGWLKTVSVKWTGGVGGWQQMEGSSSGEIQTH